MTKTITRWLVGLVMVTAGLGLMGCDKSSSNATPPEEIKPVAPAETKVEAKPTEPVMPEVDGPDVFVSEKGSFKITLPDGFPEFGLDDGATDDPEGIALTYVSEKHGRAGCMVMVNSSDGWATADSKASLDAVRDGNVNSNPENTLEKEEDFNLNGFPGRRVFIRQQSGAVTYFVRYDIILVKNRLYQVMYLTNRESDLDNPKILAYFNSFKLINPPETPK